ncbi:MAG: right-handed parallel beta-helix repeat-containing protein, partial [Deltaproteobacteria bacterium]|nr:right-handed parallel beta-helix repeat-containing protein [Deltaproteobacteria bacterium]
MPSALIRFASLLVAILSLGIAGCSESFRSTDASVAAPDSSLPPDGSAVQGQDAGEEADTGATPRRDAGTTPDAGAIGVLGRSLYVDPSLAVAHCDTYSVAVRACGSGDATAFQTFSAVGTTPGPGDTVFLRQGTYSETLAPETSGTEGMPITYRNQPGEEAILTGALSPAVDLSDRSFMVIEGLVVSDVRRWLHALRAHDVVLRGNTFRRANDSGGSAKTGLFFQEATHNRILGNTIEDTTQDNLALIKSDGNLVQGNTFRKAAHTLWTIKCGNQNVLRGNFFHNEVQKIGEIYDCDGVGFDHEFTLSNATRRNLVEENDFAYTASSGDHSP